MKYNCLFFLLFAITIACSSDPSQSAFPKRIPVDNRAEHQPDEASILNAQIKESLESIYLVETQLEDGTISNYATRDGVADFVAESTTYYKEEEKTTPLKTTIIYLTGSATDVYWLSDKVVIVSKDDYQYLFKNSVLVTTLQEGKTVEVGENDQEAAKEVLNIAQKIIQSPIPQ